MGRARGANALMAGAFESVYGNPPVSGFIQLPFVSSNLGEERGLIPSDLLGYGREPLDPTYDVANNDGDLTVPVDVRAIGHWLKLFFGPAVSVNSGAASGAIAFSAQPAVNSTITINGTVFTFVASGASGPQINIGADLAATINAAVTVLNASVIAGVAAATYAAAAPAISINHDAIGLGGNGFTLEASNDAHATLSGSTLAGGSKAHTFKSGALALPSMSIEIGNPEVPNFSTNYGVRGNQLKISLQRSGLLNAVLSMIAQGETDPVAASAAGTPTEIAIQRFAQATGSVKRAGVQLASIVGADFSFSNNLDKVDTIQEDGRIEDADPSTVSMTGALTARFASRDLYDAARAMSKGGEPIELSYGWTLGGYSLVFTMPRAFLPIVKRPVQGPNGIQSQINWEASGASGNSCTAVLTNDVNAYA